MANSTTLIIGVNLLFCLLSTATAATRLQRTIAKIRTLQAHDVMLIAALLCGITEAALQCVETQYGLGAIDTTLEPDNVAMYTKLHLLLMVSYFACNMFVKVSLLLFYRALSRDNKYFWVLCFMGIVAILFGMSSIFTVILQCLPVQKLWNPMTEGHCINVTAFYYANGAFMIGNDIILYILPILIVRDVQLSKSKAAAMNVLFALGFVVVIASVMRLVAVHNLVTTPTNTLYYDAMLLIWCTIENHLAIIIICLPACKAALVSFAPSLKSMPTSIFSNFRSRRKSSAAPCAVAMESDIPPTPMKRGSSWFSFGASTIQSGKSKNSLTTSGSRGSIFKTTQYRVSVDEVQLQKVPSVVVEERSVRPSRDLDRKSEDSDERVDYSSFPSHQV